MKYFRFSKSFNFNWELGLTLVSLFGFPRFLIVLQANRTGDYSLMSVVFLTMWAVPFILLTKRGRERIGIKKPQKYSWLVYSFLFGITFCTIIFLLGNWLYQDSIHNWFVYISNTLKEIPVEELRGENRHIYFAAFSVTAMTFSPIGEELLYRGFIHESFTAKFGSNKASILDSLAFATVHLAHFGIIYNNKTWQFVVVPALLWMGFMFLTSRIFFYCKYKTGSIYGAIVGHAGFNLAMSYFIFYRIL